MLRSAAPSDALAVAHVLIESRRAFLPFAPLTHKRDEIESWVGNHLIPLGGVSVALAGGRIVGVLAISEDQDAGWIDQLYILPGHEDQGIGTQLLKFAHENLRTPVRLYTFQENAGARRFYERHGYVQVALSDGQANEEKCPDVLYQLGADADA